VRHCTVGREAISDTATMSKTTLQIPTSLLKVGMYVSSLDRPWIETPFLFQGFSVGDEELGEIRKLCKTICVDCSEAEAAELRRQMSQIQPVKRADAEISLKPQAAPARDPVPLREELAAAKSVHANATVVLTDVMDQLRRGRQLSVPKLGVVVDSMVDSVCRNREAITWLARMKTKDDYVYGHSLASSVWALVFGRHLGLDKETLKTLSLGAMLLDIGKTRLRTDLLTKAEQLTAPEIKEVRAHVEQGIAILKESSGMDPRIVQMVKTHHERMDGSGYPDGLAADAIPLVGRIAGIVDTYDAMTSTRPYAKPKSTYDAVRQLKGLSSTWFQRELVEQFVQAVGVFPTGTLVELNTGEVGVVVGQSRYRRLRPEIMLVLDSNKQLRSDFSIIDLQTKHDADGPESVQKLWIVQGLEPGAYGIDPTEYYL